MQKHTYKKRIKTSTFSPFLYFSNSKGNKETFVKLKCRNTTFPTDLEPSEVAWVSAIVLAWMNFVNLLWQVWSSPAMKPSEDRQRIFWTDFPEGNLRTQTLETTLDAKHRALIHVGWHPRGQWCKGISLVGQPFWVRYGNSLSSVSRDKPQRRRSVKSIPICIGILGSTLKEL